MASSTPNRSALVTRRADTDPQGPGHGGHAGPKVPTQGGSVGSCDILVTGERSTESQSPEVTGATCSWLRASRAHVAGAAGHSGGSAPSTRIRRRPHPGRWVLKREVGGGRALSQACFFMNSYGQCPERQLPVVRLCFPPGEM